MQTSIVVRITRSIHKQIAGKYYSHRVMYSLLRFNGLAHVRTRLIILSVSTIVLSGCSTTENQTRDVSSEDIGITYVDACDRQARCRKLSRLIMGTDHLAQSDWTEDGQPQMSDEQVNAVLDEAAKLGINVFDTSPIYVGSVENKLGKWIKSRQERIHQGDFYDDSRLNPDRKLYTISKGGFPFDLFNSKELAPGTHSNELISQLRAEGILESNRPSEDESLPLRNVPPGTYASRLFGSKEQIVARVSEELGRSSNNLNNDIITIYLMHRDDNDFVRFKRVPREQTPVRTIMESLDDQRIANRYWAVGWSNWETERVE